MFSLRIRRPFLSLISRKKIPSVIDTLISIFLPEDKVDLAVLICTDSEIKSLNNKYRGIDSATDVLSFGSDETDPETGNHYLGDIIISYETAEKQACIANHDVQIEITILLIHGFLHLLGFDHDTEKNKKMMWEKQFTIHKTLGIDVESLPGEDD